MAEEILMPRLSDTMTEGVIAAWHKKVGDDVKKGDLLAEIETDKATMDLESYKEGTLLYTGGEKGSKIQVNDLLAIIGKKGEDISKILEKNSGVKKEEPEVAKENDAPQTADKKEESKNITPSTEKEITASSANTGTATIAEEIVL
ncbi:MAG: biotin/lipoyl-containing protein, partial [Bacteroidota bacterium]